MKFYIRLLHETPMNELLDRKHTGMLLAVVFFATFMDGVDGSIVNVALPDIGSSFGVDTATVSWVSITYMMILAGTLVAFARIAADKGIRLIMALGLAIFTISSLFCGISVSFPMLIAARAAQAVGAGMMAAAGPMCCVVHLPPEKLAFGLSIVTIGASMGFAIGPALGGAIVNFTDWNWIFLINIPLGLIAVPLMLMAVPKSTVPAGKSTLDKAGAVLLLVAIVLITFAIETLSHSDMRTYSVIAGAVGLIVLVVFIRVERNRENPLLKLSMFRRWDFALIFITLMEINMVFMGILYLVPFYAEICLGMSSLTTGLFLLSSPLVTAIFGMPLARLSDTKGRMIFCVLSGLFAVATFIIFILAADNMHWALFLTTMILMGLSWACVGGPMASRLVEHAGDEPEMASSLTNEAYYIGGAVGTALTALVFTLASGTDGIDIDSLTAPVFLSGITAAAAVLLAISATIAVLSFIVKDEKKF